MTLTLLQTFRGALAVTVTLALAGAADARNGGDVDPARGATRWTGFRGGKDVNVSRAARLPLTWSDDSVAWRATTPGFGQSSPVIWDGTVFLTSLEGAMKETIFVSAIGLSDGVERWRRTFEAAETFEWNDYVSKGAPTPAVDAPVTGFAVVDDAIVIRAGTEVIRVGQPVE